MYVYKYTHHYNRARVCHKYTAHNIQYVPPTIMFSKKKKCFKVIFIMIYDQQ